MRDIRNDPLTAGRRAIFVFGSNTGFSKKGVHGAGAALDAKKYYGAVQGYDVGLQGDSYAIPTRLWVEGSKGNLYLMNSKPEHIRLHVDGFILFARQHPELCFWLTQVGCGYAGYSKEQMMPLFEEARTLDNVIFPEKWGGKGFSE
jgi:hypothetical protein